MAARGGSRKGAGRKKIEPEQPIILEPVPPEAPKKNLATEILDSLGIPDWKCLKCRDSNCEVCLWRMYAIKERGALEYLWNRRDGKPVHIVNHLHDKPIEHTVTVTLAETIQKARKRASQR